MCQIHLQGLVAVILAFVLVMDNNCVKYNPDPTHLHNVKALCLAPRHKPLTTLADKSRADLVYSDWMQLGISRPITFERQLMSKQMPKFCWKILLIQRNGMHSTSHVYKAH